MRRHLFQRGIVPATPLDAAIAARTRDTAWAQPRFAVRQKQRPSNPSTTAPDTHPSPGTVPAGSDHHLRAERRSVLDVRCRGILPAAGGRRFVKGIMGESLLYKGRFQNEPSPALFY